MAPLIVLSHAKDPKKVGFVRSLGLLVIFLISFAGSIVALDPPSQISQYGHSVWRVQDGYFGGMPTAITETTDGYIWIGTQSDIFRFDGVRFVRWIAPSGEKLPSTDWGTLLGARDGSLWIPSGSSAPVPRTVDSIRERI